MEKLFIEVMNLKGDNNKTLIDYKQELLNYMKIEKDKIEVRKNNIRTILLYMNLFCLNEIGDNASTIQKNGLELFKKKNKDYGESYKQCGIIGILVRIIDKINRLDNLNHILDYEITDETYKDTLIDLHNYTLLGVMCIDD